jgi:hypothetical protein
MGSVLAWKYEIITGHRIVSNRVGNGLKRIEWKV